MSAIAANELQSQAMVFASSANKAIHTLGLKWSDECEMFERWLDDAANARSLTEAALDLFQSEARLAFYGVMTDRDSISRWRRVRDAARADLIAELAELEAADVSDFRADAEREIA